MKREMKLHLDPSKRSKYATIHTLLLLINISNRLLLYGILKVVGEACLKYNQEKHDRNS